MRRGNKAATASGQAAAGKIKLLGKAVRPAFGAEAGAEFSKVFHNPGCDIIAGKKVESE